MSGFVRTTTVWCAFTLDGKLHDSDTDSAMLANRLDELRNFVIVEMGPVGPMIFHAAGLNIFTSRASLYVRTDPARTLGADRDESGGGGC